jgi:hypothetical protein
MVKEIMHNYIAPVLSLCSILILPMQAAARPVACDTSCEERYDNNLPMQAAARPVAYDTSCEEEYANNYYGNTQCAASCDEVCDSGDDCEEKCGFSWCEKIGWFIAAAGVGALTAWGVSQSNKGHRGKSGCQGFEGSTGPTGPQGIEGVTGAIGSSGAIGPTGATGATGPSFLRSGDDLTFNFALLANIANINPSNPNFFVFVESPDGTVLSETIALTSTGQQTFSIPAFSIFNAEIGTYHYGVVFTPGTAVNSASLDGVVNTTRDITTTDASFNIASSLTAYANEIQFTGEFTYGNDNEFP